jgi:hypothetical protein
LDCGGESPPTAFYYGLSRINTDIIMIKELDLITLTKDLDSHGLQRGDVGTVVHCYEGGLSYEVEFVTAQGKTIAVLTFNADEISPLFGSQILHVREMTPT